MRILITNDDGVRSPGIRLLYEVAKTFSDDVWVIAPEQDHSGASHALTLTEPLRLRSLEDRWFAVTGTPVDCALMAFHQILEEQPPDLVLAGINCGQNLGEDIHYSGTVAGAMEATIHGIAGIAFSLGFSHRIGDTPRWPTAKYWSQHVLGALIKGGLRPGCVTNVNIPDLERSAIKGVMPTRQGRRSANPLRVDARLDGRGVDYYWLGFKKISYQLTPGTDLWAHENGYVSVTPLGLETTDSEELARLENGSLKS